jgi:glycosyltransferase involved in cell wall biosynthesis
VRTLATIREELAALGHEMRVISPEHFKTFACPTYPEIRLALGPGRKLAALADEFQPERIHIATEGPLGLAGRRYCQKRGLPFTTSFHTRFPDYIYARFRIPPQLTYRMMRWFHAPATRVMVATDSLQRELASHGFTNTARWSRGVDTELFRPRPKDFLALPRPIHLYVGRVAVEKNLEAFLSLDLEGSKLVVGDGPQLEELRAKYPAVVFAGTKKGAELAQHYAAADVFVFPSRTDTFGLVLLEALASGVPVAAFPVPGPLDVIGSAPVGCLDEDLRRAAIRALEIPGQRCRDYALQFTWRRCAQQFLGHLQPIQAGAFAV